ncbi:DUF5682 family protein [Paenibacillus sp. CAU 1782]
MDRLTGKHREFPDNDLPDMGQLEEGTRRLGALFNERVCNLESDTVYIPIRHHSPACSFHLLQTIAAYKPDIILIEGPESGSHLIPVLAADASEPPVSLYCSYEDEYGKAASYYPLLRYSPEYVAMKEAARLGIPALFIDLDRHPRRDAAETSDGENGGRATSAQDESLLAQSEFISTLCQKTNSRSFDELWEKLFEIRGSAVDTETFLRDVFTYCTLSRLCYSREQLESSGDLAREERMKTHIASARQGHNRVLVLTGGFHTYALIQNEAAEEETIESRESMETTESSESSESSESIKSYEPVTTEAPGNIHIYPMVYTMKEADRLNGYASGMPHVRYYDLLWDRLLDRKPNPFSRTAIHLLTALSRKLRQGHETVSTADAIEAYSMLQGLAGLRGKREGGVYELQDATLSAFVKGELTLATGKPLEELAALLTGDAIGNVAPNAFSVPIVEDFKRLCGEAGLQLKATGRNKKTLEPYAKSRHREQSRLFQCTSYLVPEFAVRDAGPDWIAGRNLNLVREAWTYGYSSLIEARLIECSIYGGALREAAERKLEEELANLPEHQSGAFAGAMLKALLMGLQDTAGRLFDRVRQALRQDGHFLSLCQTLTVLTRISQHGRLLGLEHDEALRQLVQEAYRNAVDKLPQIARAHEDEHPGIVQGIKLLAMLASSPSQEFPDQPIKSYINELLDDHGLPAQLSGVCMAVSLSLGEKTRQELVGRAQSYIRGTPDQAKQIPNYLSGVFAAARDAFLYDNELLEELDRLIGELPHEEFIAMAPELRLAFTYFTPMETALIAERVADLHQSEPEELLLPPVDEADLLRAKNLDDGIRKEFEAWKLA